MAKPRSQWLPLSHEPLQALAENLWWVRAPIPGVAMNRSMTVARLGDGRLLIWSAIALDEASMDRLTAAGEPALLVVPSALHRLDAAAYKSRFPKLRVFTPTGARRAVSQIVGVDGTLDEAPADAQVSFRPIAGIGEREGAMLVRSADGTTIVLNDLIFNMPVPEQWSLRLIVKLLGSAPGPRVSRVVKLAWCDDRAALRRELEALAAIPDLVRLVVAHDSVMHGPAARAAVLSAVEQLR